MFLSRLLSLRFIAFAVTLFAAPTIALADDDEPPFVITYVQEIEMEQDEIYRHTLMWAAETFKSDMPVIALEDKEHGIFVANGQSSFTFGFLLTYLVKLKVKIEVKEGKYKLAFSRVDVSDNNGSSYKKIEDMNTKALGKSFKEETDIFASNLLAYLEKSKTPEEW